MGSVFYSEAVGEEVAFGSKHFLFKELRDISEAVAYNAITPNIDQITREFGVQKFTYDPSDELTGSRFSPSGVDAPPLLSSRSYAYSYNGNRTEDSLTGSVTFLHDAITQDGVNRYRYDSDGSGSLTQISPKTNHPSQAFVYRVDGKVSAVASSTLMTSYSYDALGRMALKSISPVEGTPFNQSYSYVKDTARVLVSEGGDGKLHLEVTGNELGDALGSVDTNHAKAYVTDHLGSILNSEAAGGKLAYGSFGELLGAAPSISASSNPYMPAYAGYAYDAESGKYRTMHRILDPDTGRWLTRDPIGQLNGDMNSYGYVANSPVQFIDPTGLVKCTYSVSGGTLVCRSNDGQYVYQASAISGVRKGNDPNQPGGPIPVGTYEIRKVSTTGAGTWYLDPGLVGRILYKLEIARGGFLLHLPGSISEGCITATKKGNDPNIIKSIDELLQKENGANSLNVIQ